VRSSLASRNASHGAADALADEFEPLALIDALARHEVEYVIVGGIAAMHHGSVRQTDDLDVCPRWSPENLDRLGRALSELHVELAIAPGETVPVAVIDGVLLGRMDIGHLADPPGPLRCPARDPEDRHLASGIRGNSRPARSPARCPGAWSASPISRTSSAQSESPTVPRTAKPSPSSRGSKPPPAARRQRRSTQPHHGMSPHSPRLPHSRDTGLHPRLRAREARARPLRGRAASVTLHVGL
jgi:hypothetical protein